jgi:hypothetical protein
MLLSKYKITHQCHRLVRKTIKKTYKRCLDLLDPTAGEEDGGLVGLQGVPEGGSASGTTGAASLQE